MTDRLDRDAVARILARAQEIEQQSSTDGGIGDVGVAPEVLIEAAADVGIAPDAVRDSLVLDRLTAPPRGSALDRLAGPSAVVVDRQFDLTVAEAAAGIDGWLTSRHRLRNVRTDGGRVVYRRRSDTAASLGRVASGMRGEGRLGAVPELTVDVAPLLVGSTPARPRVVVRVVADRAAPRRRRLGGGGGLVGLGAAAGVVAAATAPLVAIASPVFVVGGIVVARSGRRQADRVELEIERVLSAVERGDPRPGVIGAVVRKAQRSIAQRGAR